MVFSDKVLGKKAKRWLTPRRGSGAAGWWISIGLHLLLAVGFLIGSPTKKPSDQTAKPPIKSYLVEPVEPLEVEPVVNDLQIEPRVDLEPIDLVEPPTLPEMTPAIIEQPTQAVIGLVGGSATGGFEVAAGGAEPSGTFASQFCEMQSQAQRIAYVVDYSASMVVAMEYVRQELKASIERLSPAHYFQLFFYSGAEPVSIESGQLLRATRQNRARAIRFTDEVELGQVAGTGQAGQAVVAALEQAFAAQSPEGKQPDLIYLLTDGEFDQQVVAQACRKLQKRYPLQTKVYVVGCGNKENEQALRKLSRINRGQFRFVGIDKLDAAIQKQRGR